jgi:iron(III) transport system permease protein
MARWRLAVIILLAAFVGAPLLLPFVDLVGQPAAWSAWRDFARIGSLFATTAELILGVLAIDIPLGTLFAVLLYRSDLPGRAFLRPLVVVSLFVPLPLLTSAWQAALGAGGWLGPPNPGWPWATGLRAAIWVHAAAGLPWVVWLVGQGLCWVEPEAEDDARLAVGPWRVLWRFTLPRAGGAVFAAAAWVALLTAHEITVTDLTQVRTFAEEVYTQFVLPDPDGGLAPDAAIARAVAVTLPGTLLIAFLVGAAVWRWERAVPPLGSSPDPRPLISLRGARLLASIFTFGLLGLFLAVPAASLIWKLGLHDYPESWSATTAWHFLRPAVRAHGGLIAGSLITAAIAGLLASALGLVACWLARESWSVRVILAATVALAWATPGPVVGAGLKSAIGRLVDLESHFVDRGPFWLFLYNGPSAAPVIWADMIRFFPCAVALLWPAVRLVPSTLTDSARVDGAGPGDELRCAVWPLSATAFGRAVVAVGVLALGELSASKLVATPGEHMFGATFAHVVWARMHYGVANQLAAMCLLLLVAAVIPTGLFALFRAGRNRSEPEA